jgi:hypothetical protein
MTGVRKPVENHSRRSRAKISASWFSTVSLSPWETRQTAPSFPHSHSPDEGGSISNHLRACGAPNQISFTGATASERVTYLGKEEQKELADERSAPNQH